MPSLADSTPAQLMKAYVAGYAPAGTFNGWDFKFGQLPPSPHQVIALVDQGGIASFPHLLIDFLGLQVLVRGAPRGNGYNESYLMARKIRDIILGMPNNPEEFTELDGVTERGNIVPLGYDDQDRHTWSNNFQLLVEPEANALTHRASL